MYCFQLSLSMAGIADFLWSLQVNMYQLPDAAALFRQNCHVSERI